MNPYASGLCKGAHAQASKFRYFSFCINPAFRVGFSCPNIWYRFMHRSISEKSTRDWCIQHYLQETYISWKSSWRLLNAWCDTGSLCGQVNLTLIGKVNLSTGLSCTYSAQQRLKGWTRSMWTHTLFSDAARAWEGLHTESPIHLSDWNISLIQMLSFLTFCCRCNLASLEQPVGSCSFYLAGTCVTGISLPKISWRLIFLLNCHLLKVHSTTFSLRAWCPPRWEHVSPYGDTLSGSLPQSCLCNRLAEFLIICNFLSHCFDMGDSSKALFIKFLHPWRYLECVLYCIHKQVEIAATIAGLWSSVWQYPGSRDRVEPGRRWKLAFP